jgi:hypothetical protein
MKHTTINRENRFVGLLHVSLQLHFHKNSVTMVVRRTQKIVGRGSHRLLVCSQENMRTCDMNTVLGHWRHHLVSWTCAFFKRWCDKEVRNLIKKMSRLCDFVRRSTSKAITVAKTELSVTTPESTQDVVYRWRRPTITRLLYPKENNISTSYTSVFYDIWNCRVNQMNHVRNTIMVKRHKHTKHVHYQFTKTTHTERTCTVTYIILSYLC